MTPRPRRRTNIVPDLRGPRGLCWAQDTRMDSPLILSRCTLKRWHQGPHQWAAAWPGPDERGAQAR